MALIPGEDTANLREQMRTGKVQELNESRL